MKPAARIVSILMLYEGSVLENDLSNLSFGSSRNRIILCVFFLRKYVDAYINFPKPLIAAVNGPAIGVSVTVLGLCDLVYATDKASFHTPFMTLGQSPEGCSSLTFPRLMGHAKVNIAVAVEFVNSL